MKVKINYEINDQHDFYVLQHDFYVLEADTVDELLTLNRIEMEKRGLDEDKNNCWSENLY